MPLLLFPRILVESRESVGPASHSNRGQQLEVAGRIVPITKQLGRHGIMRANMRNGTGILKRIYLSLIHI
eukprot:8807927-Pyramimonas_sp.AAC.1